jgi:catechol 2,3-dioxygenase-like lactoylglutathione lyase family enzyme
MTGHASRLLRIALNVADLARARAYYCDALGFATVRADEPVADWTRLLADEEVRVRTARLRLGRQELELVEYDPPGVEYPPGSSAADLWFQHVAIVTHDIATAYRRLNRYGATEITQGGPQRLPPAVGAVAAFKFRDPEGHPLELIQFPRGVGDPEWQSASGGPTLGIDHSALSVGDAERSLAFYGCLGLDARARQVNSGPEQDRLDGLSNVVVDVIGLQPAAERTPHVELLCYSTPRGRPCNPSCRARDIANSRLIVQVEDLIGLVQALGSLGCVASPVVELASKVHAALVQDPDGHAVVLIEYR